MMMEQLHFSGKMLIDQVTVALIKTLFRIKKSNLEVSIICLFNRSFLHPKLFVFLTPPPCSSILILNNLMMIIFEINSKVEPMNIK